jgi:hypothetical protein
VESFKVKYSYALLLIFTILEVLFYDSKSMLQGIISILEYVFVLFAFLLNRRVGIMYFISFSLLSMGAWSYVIQDDLPDNFWGIRFAGVSLNILFSFALAFYCIIFHSDKIYFKNFTKNGRLLSLLFLYAFLLGIFSYLRNINYSDNFIKDVLTYTPFFVFLLLLTLLKKAAILKIFKYGISLTIISMFLSFITGQTFEYGFNHSFLLMNGFAFIVPFSIFFLRKYYTAGHYYVLLFLMLALFMTGKVFIGGKLVIIAIIAFTWFLWHYRKSLPLLLPLIIILFFVINPILYYLTDGFNEGLIVTYKVAQVTSIFETMDLNAIILTQSSIGNVLAEAVTIFYYFLDHKCFFIFGKGLGGGIQDLFGYLSPLALPGMGYDPLNAIRNDFFRMHLPLYEISIKAGLIGFVLYTCLLINAFKSKKVFSLIFFVLMFTIFTNTKETILLSMIMMKLADD